MDLSWLTLTTVTFESQAGYNGQQFGFAAGEPYQGRDLTTGGQIIESGANIDSASNDVAVHSAAIYGLGNMNAQSFTFSSGQVGVRFYYRDELAAGVTFYAYDAFKGGAIYLSHSLQVPIQAPDTVDFCA